jgi:hypothetical protein
VILLMNFFHLIEEACCCVECILLLKKDFCHACWALFAVCGRSPLFSAARHCLTDAFVCNWVSVLFHCSTQLPDLWFLLNFVADVKGRFLVVVMLDLA